MRKYTAACMILALALVTGCGTGEAHPRGPDSVLLKEKFPPPPPTLKRPRAKIAVASPDSGLVRAAARTAHPISR